MGVAPLVVRVLASAAPPTEWPAIGFSVCATTCCRCRLEVAVRAASLAPAAARDRAAAPRPARRRLRRLGRTAELRAAAAEAGGVSLADPRAA